ncbi:MAG: hypothetical protein ACR2FV_02430 [Ornithinimicrobium sp.]|jgi:hypothetical protein|uniref:hypothetical protein n=1 Tax=Ornithinimicrobium sp. TaxID=1977084 RepID=UPI003D9BD1AB
MSVMEKRLQLLLDQERYDLVAGEAERSGRSVAAVIREAIDSRFADADAEARRAEAGRQFLALTQRPTVQDGQSGEDIAAELNAEFEDYVSKKARP